MTTLLSDLTRICRKSRTCDQCLRKIEIGERYRRQVYADGGLQVYLAHEDCDQASVQWAANADFDPRYDDFPVLCEAIAPEDYGWLLKEFPGVADRFNIQGPVQP